MITLLEHLEANVFSPCRKLAECVNDKIKMEQFMIMQMHNQSARENEVNVTFKNNIMMQGDAWNYDFGMWLVVASRASKIMRSCHSGISIKAKQLKLNPSMFRDRMHYVGKCAAFTDVMETYMTFGCDPALPSPPATGKC